MPDARREVQIIARRATHCSRRNCLYHVNGIDARGGKKNVGRWLESNGKGFKVSRFQGFKVPGFRGGEGVVLFARWMIVEGVIVETRNCNGARIESMHLKLPRHKTPRLDRRGRLSLRVAIPHGWLFLTGGYSSRVVIPQGWFSRRRAWRRGDAF